MLNLLHLDLDLVIVVIIVYDKGKEDDRDVLYTSELVLLPFSV